MFGLLGVEMCRFLMGYKVVWINGSYAMKVVNVVCWLKLLFELAWNMLQGCCVSLSDGINGCLMIVRVVLVFGKVVR